MFWLFSLSFYFKTVHFGVLRRFAVFFLPKMGKQDVIITSFSRNVSRFLWNFNEKRQIKPELGRYLLKISCRYLPSCLGCRENPGREGLCTPAAWRVLRGFTHIFDEYICKIWSRYLEKRLSFAIWNVKKTTFQDVPVDSGIYSYFQILSDFCRSKSVLGSFLCYWREKNG